MMLAFSEAKTAPSVRSTQTYRNINRALISSITVAACTAMLIGQSGHRKPSVAIANGTANNPPSSSMPVVCVSTSASGGVCRAI